VRLEQSFFVEYFKPDRQERAILIAMSPASNDCTCMGTCAIAEVASALNLAPNNGRNCSAAPASAGQYVAATAEAALLTGEFASGLGAGNQTFGPNTATSQVLGQSAGVQEVLGAYLITGRSSGLYTFGASGAYVAGGNPAAQFVGSFRYSISGGVLTVTNTTSVRSLTYDQGPQYQRGSFPTPGGTYTRHSK
jgi:hypothetical protein